MYGQNAPRGFVPLRHDSGAEWNNQLNSDYTIASGYKFNIGRGSLVYIGATDGFIHSIWDQPTMGAPAVQASPSLGVFWGCIYDNSVPNNTIPGPPGKTSWVGGTATLTGAPAQALIITDPTVVYTAQCNATTGFTIVSAGQKFYNVGVGAGMAQGNNPPGETLNADGTSTMLIDLATGVLALVTCPIRTVALDPNPLNIPAQGYNNALCMIQNQYMFGGSVAGVY